MVTSTASNVKMNPTYFGYIGSTKDALLIIQAVLNNQLLAVPRRPHDVERSELIKSGNVFVFIEEKSGIKRWTDGVAWSPSRILGRFLVYRELDRPALNTVRGGEKGKNGDKTKKLKRKSLDNILPSGKPPVIPAALQKHSLSYDSTGIDPLQGTTIPIETGNSNTVPDRSLVGSLIASYAFKEYGLIKKTMSLTISRNESQKIGSSPSLETVHLVSYYSAEDVLNGKLLRPVDSATLRDLQLSTELWNAVKDSSLGGKIPIEDEAFYFMDESNPNAIALGFNPAIHLQPQYQQHNQHGQQQSATPQQPHQDTSVQQQQQQQQHQNSNLNQGFSYSSFNQQFGIPQYQIQPQPQQQQQFQQSFPQSQAQQTQIPLPPRAHHHSINHPIQHSQSGSFSLPVPHDYNNNANFQDLSQIPIQYNQPSQQNNHPHNHPHHQQQPPPQQMRFSPNQNFVASQFQPPITYPQGNAHDSTSSTSSSGFASNLQRAGSPNSPRSKHESNSPIVPATQSSLGTSYNLSTPRQPKNAEPGAFNAGNFSSNVVGNPGANMGNPAFYINPATGAPMLGNVGGNNGNAGGPPGTISGVQSMGQMTPIAPQAGRLLYDETGQIGSFGFQSYANNSGTPN